jgi:hypothetical protein
VLGSKQSKISAHAKKTRNTQPIVKRKSSQQNVTQTVVINRKELSNSYYKCIQGLKGKCSNNKQMRISVKKGKTIKIVKWQMKSPLMGIPTG